MRSKTNHRRNLVFVNQYYPPDRSATAGVLERIVEYFANSFSITVLAGRPSYLPIERHRWKPLYHFNFSKYRIIRVGSLSYPRKNKLYRSLNYISYLLFAAAIALFSKSDLILSMTDPPLSGVIGAITSKLKRIPFIYYIQDLHPEMAIASGMIRAGIISNVWNAIHKCVLKSAKRIIVIGDDMRDRIINKGISKDKIVVIRHGAAKHAKAFCADEQLIKKIRNRYSFTFVHAGNIGYYGAWESIIRAVNVVQNDNIGFIFVGEGQNKERLMQLSKSCQNIEFIPYQPREKVRSVLESGDVHIITIKKGLEGLVVPSKLYPILSVRKPILAICPDACDVARIVRHFNCGLVADPDSPDKIAEAINHFYLSRKNLTAFCENSEAASKCYNQEGQLEFLKKEIENAI